MAVKPRARSRTTTPALKPVGVTDDGKSVLLARRSGAKNPSFRLAIDDDLVRQLEAAEERMEAAAAARKRVEVESEPEAVEPVSPREVVSKLSPREVQALLRQGRTAASIARKAGVDVAWVERFETPIIWERAGMATRAQRATLSRTRRGISGLPLGEAVRTNLKRRRIAVSEQQMGEAWDAIRTRKKARTWIVSFSFANRGRTRVAEWEFDPALDKLKPLNDLAGDLGFVAQTRRRTARA